MTNPPYMQLFYAPEAESGMINLTLPEDESAHAVRVLRMKSGDHLWLTNGKGCFFETELVRDHPKKAEVRILKTVSEFHPASPIIGIAIAPTKSIDRFEWFLEKVTEIGCDHIYPILCRHSERDVIKTERLQKVLVSAMKQCLKASLPVLHPIQPFRNLITNPPSFFQQKFIAHVPELDTNEFPPAGPNGRSLGTMLRSGNRLIMIGPEGGFSEEEAQLAVKSGFSMVNLGQSRLRVETAGVAACTLLKLIQGD